MKEKKQSSIEWLIEQIVNRQNGESNSKSLDEIFIESKQLHKKEIIEAYNQGYREAEIDNNLMMNYKDVADYNNGINYYTEKYGQ